MKKSLALLAIFVLGGFVLNSFTTSEKETYVSVAEKELNPLWKGYTDWYKVTKDAPNTGDPTGFLDGKHKGTKAFREIYVNSVGEATIQKSGDNAYPAGTVIVKAAFKNKAAWEANKKPQLTIMVKLDEGKSPETSDWGYVMGAGGKVSTGTSKWAKFCSKCHVFAQSKDFVFMNADQLAAGK
jgi:hypothetical protein